MPQTASPVDPIPNPPSAKIPAGGTLCKWRGHTCASLACRYGAALPARLAKQQAARLGMEKSVCPWVEDPREDADSRLWGKDAASLPQGQRGVGTGSPTRHCCQIWALIQAVSAPTS